MNSRLKHFRDLCRELHTLADDFLWDDALLGLGPVERAAIERRIDAKLKRIAIQRGGEFVQDEPVTVIRLSTFLRDREAEEQSMEI